MERAGHWPGNRRYLGGVGRKGTRIQALPPPSSKIKHNVLLSLAFQPERTVPERIIDGAKGKEFS